MALAAITKGDQQQGGEARGKAEDQSDGHEHLNGDRGGRPYGDAQWECSPLSVPIVVVCSLGRAAFQCQVALRAQVNDGTGIDAALSAEHLLTFSAAISN